MTPGEVEPIILHCRIGAMTGGLGSGPVQITFATDAERRSVMAAFAAGVPLEIDGKTLLFFDRGYSENGVRMPQYRSAVEFKY